MTRAQLRRSLDGLMIVAVALVALTVTAKLKLAPRDPTAQVAVVFAPWTSSGAAVANAAEAGARVVNVGRLTSVVIAQPERADYAARAGARGAWLVADAAALLGCFSALTP